MLHSGHWLIDHRDGRGTGAVGAASRRPRVTFADVITDAEIDAYVATGEPLEVAGAFTIDSLGGAFITEVRRRPARRRRPLASHCCANCPLELGVDVDRPLEPPVVGIGRALDALFVESDKGGPPRPIG